MILEVNPDSAIQPLTDLTNRKQKNKFQKEALRVVNHLEEINTSFLYELFNEDTVKSYGDLFQTYNQQWAAKVQEICTKTNIRHIGIDSKWFERNYQPRANERVRD